MVGRRFDHRLVLLAVMAAPLCAASAPQPPGAIVQLGADVAQGRPLALHIGGRVVTNGTAPNMRYQRQWPGTYLEARFRGPAVDLAVGPGDVSLRITVDGRAPIALVRPAVARYRIAAPGTGDHRIRVDVVSESQAGPTSFGGLFAPLGTTPLAPPPPRRRQIEFIGDSHTVGYGNTATTTDCTQDQVWGTTDTPHGPAGITAAHYDADYQINAISGRGIVRNYDGFAAPTMPQAYPYALLDGKTPERSTGWHPQVVVFALGTNDFSTKLKLGERWATRDALHADYERTYAAFVRQARQRYPGAFVLLWATDLANGEIAREASLVAANLRQAGDRRIAFVEVDGLHFTGCHGHPDLADDRTIAATLERVIDAQPRVWDRHK
ncbi:SGNH/GDSL hydrolase family protein [Sphingomonas sp. GC_Shp_3]|uniref:SGNH/GDSL hydrolase family protein n=1 Tax=Sphingomonas sp. GC_Shp_3 TaxID=2937383 RepID=UPI00226A020A|nr:SGNH/GDSL hydrolase family protein [Sphingomonas sp. GC_Shp_3]